MFTRGFIKKGETESKLYAEMPAKNVKCSR